MTSKHKVLVLNPKGGTGKSTFSFQILSPYFYSKYKENPLVLDVDDQNQESKTYGRSEIIDTKKILTSNIKRQDLCGDRNIILDAGASISSKEIIDLLVESGSLNKITFFAIPITQGTQPTKLALDMYNYIRKFNEKGRILFILNNYNVEYSLTQQFPSFLGDKEFEIYTQENKKIGIYDKILDEDSNVSYIAIPNVGCLFWSSYYGKTTFEFAENEDKYDAELNRIETNSPQNINSPEYKNLEAKKILAHRSKRFRNEILEEKIFLDLDKFLNVQKEKKNE